MQPVLGKPFPTLILEVGSLLLRCLIFVIGLLDTQHRPMPSSWFHTITTRLVLLTPGQLAVRDLFAPAPPPGVPNTYPAVSFYTISPNETINIHTSRIQLTLSGSPLPSGASQPGTFTILKSLQTVILRFRPPSISILRSLNKRSRMSGGLELSKPHSPCVSLFPKDRSSFDLYLFFWHPCRGRVG
jgi:hypothetical protein